MAHRRKLRRAAAHRRRDSKGRFLKSGHKRKSRKRR